MSGSGSPPQDDEGWRAYHEQIFDLAAAPSAFVRWKIRSSGVHVARDLADARNTVLERWRDQHGRWQADWPVQHPPVVVVMREQAARPACLGCLWIGSTSDDFAAAGAAARAHASQHSDEADVLALGPVPVVQRADDDDDGVPTQVL